MAVQQTQRLFAAAVVATVIVGGGPIVTVSTAARHPVAHLASAQEQGSLLAAPSCNGVVATIWGSGGADILEGTSGDDVIHGLGGADEINGRGGNDVICGGGGADVIRGHGGADQIWGGNAGDTIYGGAGADQIWGGGGADDLRGGGGGDEIRGGGSGDELWGKDGSDLLLGNGGDDVLRGGEGADTLNGGSGVDTLYGNFGDDTLEGGNGVADECRGGQDTDTANQPCEQWHSIEWGPPMFWPLRTSLRVGCAKDSVDPFGICNGHHPYWAIDVGDANADEAKGAAVHSAGSGVVTTADASVTGCTGSGQGSWVEIDHGGGTSSVYYHLGDVTVSVGQMVTPATKIGEVGNTGAVFPCDFHHLHYERWNGAGIDVDPGELAACLDGVYVTYPDYWGESSWDGFTAHQWFADSDGATC